MKKTLYLLFSCIMVFTFLSCQTNRKGNEFEVNIKNISTIIENYKPHTNIGQYKVMLIIPAKGCDSCIKGSLDFVRNNYQKEHLGFIISGLSRRELRLIVGDESINRSNVIVDDLDYAHQFKLIDVKPKVIFLQKGKVNNAIELTALNSATTLQDIN